MAQKKTAHGSPWTKEAVRELKGHSKARTPLSEIAKKMKRTERALRRKSGNSRHRPGPSPCLSPLRCCRNAAGTPMRWGYQKVSENGIVRNSEGAASAALSISVTIFHAP